MFLGSDELRYLLSLFVREVDSTNFSRSGSNFSLVILIIIIRSSLLRSMKASHQLELHITFIILMAINDIV